MSARTFRPTPYLAFLLVYLTLVEFFDSFATAFRYHMTTYVREDFGASLSEMLRLLSWVFVGSCLGFVPRMAADVFGRRIVLWAVLVGLCGLQWLVGLARTPGEYAFLLTLLAIFYKSDIWTLVMSEEAPRERRAFYTALPALAGGLGAVVLGTMVRGMGEDVHAWRAVAQFPIWGILVSIPCLLAMRETRVFVQARAERGRLSLARLVSEPFRGRYTRPLVVVTALKLVYISGATVGIGLIATEFLRVENGFPPRTVGRLIQVQTVSMILGALTTAYLSDRFGRVRMVRLVAALYSVSLMGLAMAPVGTLWVAGCFILQGFFDAGVIAMLRIMTMESFASRFRSTGVALTDLVPTAASIATSWALGVVTGAEIPLATIVLAIGVTVLVLVPAFNLLPETRQVDLRHV